MGCNESSISDCDERGAAIDASLPKNPTKSDFQKARAQSTVEVGLRHFKEIGTCLNGKQATVLPQSMSKVCFLCCNTYTKAQYALGVGPMNDALTVAENHKKRGYEIYFIHNGTPKEFLDFLAAFLKGTQVALTVFFTGHGASVPDKNGDESDGFDEAMVFDTGHIIDDTLAEYLGEHGNGKCRIMLLTDCCHSGSIWDIQSSHRLGVKLPPHIMSLSAAKDSQTAKQTRINQKDQGIFTYYFWKTLNENPKMTAKQMEAKINPLIAKFKQHFTIASTSPDMETSPLFP